MEPTKGEIIERAISSINSVKATLNLMVCTHSDLNPDDMACLAANLADQLEAAVSAIEATGACRP